MYSRWGDPAGTAADLLGLGSRPLRASALTSAAGSLAEAAASALTSSELAASLSSSAAFRQHQAAAAAAAHYGFASSGSLGGAGGLGTSSLGSPYASSVVHAGQGAAASTASMASRLLYGATAAESAILRHQAQRSMQETYARQQRTAQAIMDKASLERELENQAIKERRERNAQLEEAAAHRFETERKRDAEERRSSHSSRHQIIEIDSDSDRKPEHEPTQRKAAKRKDKKEKHSHESTEFASASKKKRKTTKERKEAASATGTTASLDSRNKAERLVSGVISNHLNQPVVVIQNWSKERLMNELMNQDPQRATRLISAILERITGFTAISAPPDVTFPPKSMEVSVPMLNRIIGIVEKDMYDHLFQAIEKTFYKCAHSVEEGPKDLDSIAKINTAVPLTDQASVEKEVPPNPESNPVSQENRNVPDDRDVLIAQQTAKILELEAKIAKIAADRDHVVESLEREQIKLRDQLSHSSIVQSRTTRAFMRASVDSLRALRQSLVIDSDSEEVDQ